MVAWFTLASFLGAFLLFLIQPAMAKMALPTLGGAPYVWNGCMVFFQTSLLGGYLYAHMATRLPPRVLVVLHVALLLAAAWLTFPLTFVSVSGVEPVQAPLAWLFLTLACSIGLPFFVVSATAPLLQHWFGQSAHPQAQEPYFLYAASNAGSFMALLGYPLVVEPQFTLVEQGQWFVAGYGVLILLFAAVGYYVWRFRTNMYPVKAPVTSALSWRPRAHWVITALIPASLLYGVTTYLTTDLASVPLIWVAPLALYLLTFIIAFGHHPRMVALAQELHLPAALVLMIFLLIPMSHQWWLMAVHLTVFFIVALSCHGTLAKHRPPAAQLTEYYLWLSLGGVLGGLCNTFVAPLLFNSVAEYPLMLALSAFVATRLEDWRRERRAMVLGVLGAIAAACAVYFLLNVPAVEEENTKKIIVKMAMLMVVILSGIGYFLLRARPIAVGVWLLSMFVFIGPSLLTPEHLRPLFSARNFFGVNRVTQMATGNAHIFTHGNTNHGVQSLEEALRLQPASYYIPLQDVFASLPRVVREKPMAVLGLGVGTIACYGKKNQVVDFYEIDPLVERIARDPQLFTYLRDCPPTTNVILGDGRLKIADAPAGHYGLMVMDAFSSDAIPMHLLTSEAMGVYLVSLAQHGMLAFNISNRHLDLKPVLSAIAQAHGLSSLARYDDPGHDAPAKKNPLHFASEWVILARHENDLAALQATHPGWKPLPAPDTRYLWTDQKYSLFKVIR